MIFLNDMNYAKLQVLIPYSAYGYFHLLHLYGMDCDFMFQFLTGLSFISTRMGEESFNPLQGFVSFHHSAVMMGVIHHHIFNFFFSCFLSHKVEIALKISEKNEKDEISY